MSRRRYIGDSKYYLDVIVNPAGVSARVIIDGISQFTDLNGKASFRLNKGTYTYIVEASSYDTQEGSITINGNQVLNITLVKHVPKTVLLCHFDGNLIDATGNFSIVNHGLTFTTGKFGQCIDARNGWGEILNASKLSFDKNDFTIDWWEYQYGLSKGNIFGTFGKNGNGMSVLVGHGAEGSYRSYFDQYSTSDWAVRIDMGARQNGWVHRAVVRKGNTFASYQNGKMYAGKTSSMTVNPFLTAAIGRHGMYTNDASNNYNGLIDELRISNVARWESSFTPPTSPYEVD